MANAEIANTTYETDAYAITHISLGRGVATGPERLDHPALYVVSSGTVTAVFKEDGEIKERDVHYGESFIRPAYVLAYFRAVEDSVYTEIRFPNRANLAQILREKEIFYLTDLIHYSGKNHVNILRLINDSQFKLNLIAMDPNTQREEVVLTEGDAVAICLEGSVSVYYDHKEYKMHKGECIMCAMNHTVHLQTAENTKVLTLVTKDDADYE